MHRFRNVVRWLVIALFVVVSLLNIIFIFRLYDEQRSTNRRVEEIINSLPQIPKVINGINGRDGVDGETKIVHETVITTLPAKDGVNGKSAYEVALSNGFVGTEQDWLESLKSPVLVPMFRCNALKNRWETKFVGDATWKILNGEVVPCVGVL